MPLPLENFRSPLALFRFYGICLLGLMLDLTTKYIAQENLQAAGPYFFIPGWLHFEWVENTGAVFGIGAGRRWLFVSVSVLALGFLTWLFAVSQRQRFSWGYQIILGMLLAGVLGNLYDRVMFAHVRDMIHALPGWKWPGAQPGSQDIFPYVFNVADVLLCTGVALMLLHAAMADWILKEKPTPLAAPSQPG